MLGFLESPKRKKRVLYFDDVCYDIYLNDNIIHKGVKKHRFYDIASELLTEEQHSLFMQGEREFEYLD